MMINIHLLEYLSVCWFAEISFRVSIFLTHNKLNLLYFREWIMCAKFMKGEEKRQHQNTKLQHQNEHPPIHSESNKMKDGMKDFWLYFCCFIWLYLVSIIGNTIATVCDCVCYRIEFRWYHFSFSYLDLCCVQDAWSQFSAKYYQRIMCTESGMNLTGINHRNVEM